MNLTACIPLDTLRALDPAKLRALADAQERVGMTAETVRLAAEQHKRAVKERDELLAGLGTRTLPTTSGTAVHAVTTSGGGWAGVVPLEGVALHVRSHPDTPPAPPAAEDETDEPGTDHETERSPTPSQEENVVSSATGAGLSSAPATDEPEWLALADCARVLGVHHARLLTPARDGKIQKRGKLLSVASARAYLAAKPEKEAPKPPVAPSAFRVGTSSASLGKLFQGALRQPDGARIYYVASENALICQCAPGPVPPGGSVVIAVDPGPEGPLVDVPVTCPKRFRDAARELKQTCLKSQGR